MTINQHADEYGTAFSRIGQSNNWESGPLTYPDAKHLVAQLLDDGHHARALFLDDIALVTVEETFGPM